MFSNKKILISFIVISALLFVFAGKKSGHFVSIGEMNRIEGYNLAVLLENGQVLLVGAECEHLNCSPLSRRLTFELFHPENNQFELLQPLPKAPQSFIAKNGK